MPCMSTRRISTLGTCRSRGFEASIKTRLADNWNVLASYSYVDPVITKDTAGAAGTPWIAARHRASLWSDYTVDHGPLAGIGAGAGVRFSSGFYNYRVDVDMPSVTLVDLNLSYDFGKKSGRQNGVSGGVNVTNLFDRKYFLGTGTEFYYGEARIIRGRLSYRF